MAKSEMDVRPVSHITTDALGKPGKRTFYLQAFQGERVVTLIVEKIQVQSLAVWVEQFLLELKEKYPDLKEASDQFIEANMHINPPVDPLFRVGEMGLGYDADLDLVVLQAREILAEDQDPEDASLVRFWCTRDQLRAMSRWGVQVSGRGRPTCPQCGEPMDPEGHFCPKRNGHKH